MVMLIAICNAEVFDGYTLFSPTGGGPGGGTGEQAIYFIMI